MTNLSKIFTVGAVLGSKTKSLPKKKWRGTWPANCDLCYVELANEDKFYDAKVGCYGPWGLMCKDCFQRYNCKLGLGRGQEYDAKTLEKTGG